MPTPLDSSAATYMDEGPATGSASRACIVRFDVHPGDSRIENQAQALIEDGYSVDLICMRFKDEPLKGISNGIRMFRIPTLERYRGNIILYAVEYAAFCMSVFFVLSFLQIRYRYKIVHICNLPDFLVFTALVSKLYGAKIILDFRESMVEMVAAKYELALSSPRLWPLSTLERACVAFADQGLTCTEQMKAGIVSRGTSEHKISIMLNSVDPAKFYSPKFPDPAAPVGSSFNIITHGSVIPRYGHQILIRSMPLIRQEAPEARLLILGDGQERPALEALAKTLEVDDIVDFTGWVSVTEMLSCLRKADVGAVTMVRNAETDLIHTLKMFEYMELGLPVIISRTSAVEGYFDDSMVRFFDANNVVDLAEGLLYLRNNPMQRLHYAQNAYKRCRRYNTDEQKKTYLSLVNRLTNNDKKVQGSEQSLTSNLGPIPAKERSD